MMDTKANETEEKLVLNRRFFGKLVIKLLQNRAKGLAELEMAVIDVLKAMRDDLTPITDEVLNRERSEKLLFLEALEKLVKKERVVLEKNRYSINHDYKKPESEPPLPPSQEPVCNSD